MKVGDLVIHAELPGHGVGIIMQVYLEMWGFASVPAGVKVLWTNPIWITEDGGTIMYEDELEVINESR